MLCSMKLSSIVGSLVDTRQTRLISMFYYRDTVSFETALAWTLVLLLLKSVYLNPKSKLRVVDIYKIRFNRALWFF